MDDMSYPMQLLFAIWGGGLVVLWFLFRYALSAYRRTKANMPQPLRGLNFGMLAIPPDENKVLGLIVVFGWLTFWFVAGFGGYMIYEQIKELVYGMSFAATDVILGHPDERWIIGFTWGIFVGFILAFAILWRLVMPLKFRFYQRMLQRGKIPAAYFPKGGYVDDEEDASEPEEDYVPEETRRKLEEERQRAIREIQNTSALTTLWNVWRAGNTAWLIMAFLITWFIVGGITVVTVDAYTAVTKDGVQENRFWSLASRTIAWENVVRTEIRYWAGPMSFEVYPQSGKSISVSFLAMTEDVQRRTAFVQVMRYVMASTVSLEMYVFDNAYDQRTIEITSEAREELRVASDAIDAYPKLITIMTREIERGKPQ